MKKLFWVFIGLFMLMIPVIGQDVNPPAHIWQVISDLAFYLGTPEAFTVAIPVVTAFITGVFKVEQNWPKKIISWAIAVVGLVGANLLNFGFVADYTIWEAIAVGLLIGLAANGFFSISFIKPILDRIHEMFSNNTTKIMRVFSGK